jgi:hypothetical protein
VVKIERFCHLNRWKWKITCSTIADCERITGGITKLIRVRTKLETIAFIQQCNDGLSLVIDK